MGVYSLCTPTAPHSAQRQVVNGGSLATRDMIGRYSNRLGCFGWSDDWRPLATGGRVAKKRPKTRRNQAKRSRPAAKRDLVRRPKASAYAKRTATGRFTEMDDVGASQRADKRRKAKTTVGSGYGDSRRHASKQKEQQKTLTAHHIPRSRQTSARVPDPRISLPDD